MTDERYQTTGYVINEIEGFEKSKLSRSLAISPLLDRSALKLSTKLSKSASSAAVS